MHPSSAALHFREVPLHIESGVDCPNLKRFVFGTQCRYLRALVKLEVSRIPEYA